MKKNPLDKIQDNLVEAINTYEEGENVVVNNGQIMMESEVAKENSPKKLNDTEIYDILKKSASQEELREFPDEIKKAQRSMLLKSKPFKKNNLVHNILEINSVIPEARVLTQEPKPEFNFEKYIAEKSQEKLEREQREYDNRYGKFGLAALRRPV